MNMDNRLNNSFIVSMNFEKKYFTLTKIIFMKIKLLVLILFCSFLSQAQLNWVQMPSLSPARFSPSSFMIGTKFYVSNGQLTNGTLLSDLWEYDLTTNLWTQKASIPVANGWYADKGFTINGIGYITCAGTASGNYDNSLYQYNPQTNAWATKASFPGVARYTATQFSIGNYGYVGMGFSPYYNDMYRYDPDADAWTQMANFTGTARQSAFCFVIGASAFIGMGSDGSTNNPSDFYRFDTTGTGIWTQLSPFPGSARNSGASFSFGGHGYIMCGTNAAANQMDSDIWEYTPSTDSWAQIGTFPGGARREVAYGNYDSLLIIGAGAVTDGDILTSSFWQTCFGGCYPLSTENINRNSNIVNVNGRMLKATLQSATSSPATLHIYDLTGREVMTSDIAIGQTTYEKQLNEIAASAYIYLIRDRSSAILASGKFVITE
jgi:N-acetylneuraminic acid mutarotase